MIYTKLPRGHVPGTGFGSTVNDQDEAEDEFIP